ncbi:hypothetical protein [Bradyrhizobium sp. WSM3983]|uniref:hypothetical protein n=1 Tax=Bradyrhizobium sp. WSM3983 TaxID=1038867 RepID=UPI00048828D2
MPKRDADVPPNALDRSCMIASGPPPNQLLRMLDAADFDLLRPHLITIELVRETVLGEAGRNAATCPTFRMMEMM